MRKLIQAISIVFTTTAQLTNAMNYHATDLLLVFREDGGYNDVEFNIGSVSNYFNLATGTQIAITYDTNLVKANFGDTFSGVKMAVVGATSPLDSGQAYIWVTDLSLATNSPPTAMTGSKLSTVRGKIDQVGVSATANTQSNAAPFVISSANGNSYSQTVSGGTGTAIGTFNGDIAFTVEAAYPSTLTFYEVTSSGLTPKPPARFVGSFTLGGNGTVTFTAGALPVLPAPWIVGITRNSGASVVSFTTSNGVNYRLYSSTNLPGPWTASPGSVPGDNTVRSINDTTDDPQRFYRVQSSY